MGKLSKLNINGFDLTTPGPGYKKISEKRTTILNETIQVQPDRTPYGIFYGNVLLSYFYNDFIDSNFCIITYDGIEYQVQKNSDEYGNNFYGSPDINFNTYPFTVRSQWDETESAFFNTLMTKEESRDSITHSIKIQTFQQGSLQITEDFKEAVNKASMPLIQITYSELKKLRDSSKLIPGMQYRITDYVCTTTQAESRAVSHPYDIIVTADSTNVLNENARACLHEGDTYYSAEGSQANLAAWELKYCIDNDADRFLWADPTNGKGVVYWLKDEHNNECPYDFKQIQFKRYEITACEKIPSLIGSYAATTHSTNITIGETFIWAYTFSVYDSDIEAIEDMSVFVHSVNGSGECSANILSEGFYDSETRLMGFGLLNIVFFNTFRSYCSSNTFGNYCYSNTFGSGCSSNMFGNSCSDNTFENNCGSNMFGDNCHFNTFGYGCSGNTFGYGCSDNTFGDNCNFNTLGNYCSFNAFETQAANGVAQYYHIMDGVSGTSSTPNTINPVYNRACETWVGLDSSNTLKTWVPADLAQ